jgi:hypothetical protein
LALERSILLRIGGGLTRRMRDSFRSGLIAPQAYCSGCTMPRLPPGDFSILSAGPEKRRRHHIHQRSDVHEFRPDGR